MGKALAARNIELVYGGGDDGLMGALARSVLHAGGSIIGVYPHWMPKIEHTLREVSDRVDMRIVDTMHQRKALMAELADGLITMPGGFGTMEETFEMLSWRQLELHTKPIAFLDVDGFYEPLFDFSIELFRKAFSVSAAELSHFATRISKRFSTDFEAQQPTTIDEWTVEEKT